MSNSILTGLVSASMSNLLGSLTTDRRHAGRGLSYQMASTVSDSIAADKLDIENILATLPDTQMSMEVLVSSILSPDNYLTTHLQWGVDNIPPEKISPEKILEMVEFIRSYFEDTYDIKRILSKILEDSLFKAGSYSLVVIPESEIDSTEPSQSLESISSSYVEYSAESNSISVPQHLGIFFKGGSAHNVPQKDGFDPNLIVTDNLDVLKFPAISENHLKFSTESKLNAYRKNNKIWTAMESVSTRNPIGDLPGCHVISNVDIRDRITSGVPLVITPPAESILPFFRASQPEVNMGAIILLDDDGNPLKISTKSTHISAMNLRRNGNGGDANGISQVLEGVAQQYTGTDINKASNKEYIRMMTAAYSSMVDIAVRDKLKTDGTIPNIDFKFTDDIYRVMFARKLANKYTQMLFIPKELLTYVTFNVNEDGIGESLLQKSKILAGLRSTTQFANVMSMVNNSTPNRVLDIQLPPDDPDPETTLNVMLHRYNAAQADALPYYSTSPTDIPAALRDANTSIQVQGSSLFPEASMNIEDRTGSRTSIETELDENLRNRHIQTLSMLPELVDGSFSPEFAAQIVSGNIYQTKRVMLYQNAFEPFIADHVKKYSQNSGYLLTGLISILNDAPRPNEYPIDDVSTESDSESPFSLAINTDDGEVHSEVSTDDLELVLLFISKLYTKLPKPELTKLDSQMEQFGKYADAVDAVLEVYITPDIIDRINANAEEPTETDLLVSILRGHILRKYISENNILPEINDIFKLDTEQDTMESTVLESYATHVSKISGYIDMLMAKIEVPEEADPDDDNQDQGEMDQNTDADAGDFNDEPDGDTIPEEEVEVEVDDTETEETPDETPGEEEPVDEDTSTTDDEEPPESDADAGGDVEE